MACNFEHALDPPFIKNLAAEAEKEAGGSMCLRTQSSLSPCAAVI
jgi:hypothetical protein